MLILAKITLVFVNALEEGYITWVSIVLLTRRLEFTGLSVGVYKPGRLLRNL